MMVALWLPLNSLLLTLYCIVVLMLVSLLRSFDVPVTMLVNVPILFLLFVNAGLKRNSLLGNNVLFTVAGCDAIYLIGDFYYECS